MFNGWWSISRIFQLWYTTWFDNLHLIYTGLLGLLTSSLKHTRLQLSKLKNVAQPAVTQILTITSGLF